MIATTRLTMTDLARQKRYEADLSGELTVDHEVAHAVDLFRERTGIPDNGLRWNAFSRGRRLDQKARLSDLRETDSEWVVVPEISAGAE